jgi:hypothetical protein
MTTQNKTYADSVAIMGEPTVNAFELRVRGGIFLTWIVLLVLCGCSGSGEGLDEQGNPIRDDTPPVVEPPPGETPPEEIPPEEMPPEEIPPEEMPPVDDAPTFTSIQETVFVPFCVCHVGAAAPFGLVLDSAATFDLLVATPSGQMPNLFRIEPGNPDSSYLIHKLEGGPVIAGFQMPPTELGEQHLPQETIDLMREWIAAGALNN